VEHAGGRASWRHGRPGYPGYPGYPGGYHPIGHPWPWLGLYGWYGWYGAYGPGWAYSGPPPYAWVVPYERRADAPAWIETDVRPGKARVLLDGTEVGLAKDYNGTWDRLAVSPGRHTVEFRRDGYRTLRIETELEPGRAIRIERRLSRGEGEDPSSVRLPPPPAAPPAVAASGPAQAARGGAGLTRGLIRFDVAPPDAAVYLDGEYLARADELIRMHGAIPVAVGTHQVDVVRPGFRDASTEVEVGENGPAKVVVRLEER